MSELDQNIPDDFWRKAFEEAAETPPLRVWDAVERRLDEGDKPKVLPLWGAGFVSSRPLMWGTGVAAAVALALIGWWMLRAVPATESRSVAHQLPAQTESTAVTRSTPNETTASPLAKTTPGQPAIRTGQPNETVAFNTKAAGSINKPSDTTPAQPVDVSVMDQEIADPLSRIALAPAADQQHARSVPPRLAGEPQRDVIQSESIAADQQSLVMSPAAGKRANFRAAAQVNESVDRDNAASLAVLDAVSVTPLRQNPSFDALATRALRLKSPAAIQRIVWFRPAEPSIEPERIQPKRAGREAWASLSMMPGAFNPTVAIRSAQASLAKTTALSNSSVNQPAIASRANFSVAYQAGAGVQLNERWSVESGVGYLAGRSTVDSPVQQTAVYSLLAASPAATPRETTLYVDALRTSVANASPAAGNVLVSADFTNTAANRYSMQNNYNPQARQTIANDYQFVQVPVQIGYQLRPRKRLGMALIGGFLSNIFVRNTVGDELVVTAKDGVYKPVSLAATLGARFRYRPSKQWSASLAGMYQPSLGTGTRPESVVQSRPTSTGMSFGIDYHF
jgi:hypothetical protein